MVVRELIALFGFKADPKSAENVQQQADSLFSKIKSIAAIGSAVAVGFMLKGVAEGVGRLANEVSTSAKRLGVTTQELQKLRAIAGSAGISATELGVGLKSLAKNAFEATEGNKEVAKTFNKLGVRLRDSSGKLKSVDQLLEESADGFRSLRSNTERAALAQRVFGQAGSALVPLLSRGSAEIASMRKEADELGSIIDDDLIMVSGRWGKSIKSVRAGMQGLKNAVGKAILPVMTRLNQSWVQLLRKHGQFIRSVIFKVVDGMARSFEALLRVVVGTIDAFAGWVNQLDPLGAKLFAVGVGAAALAILLALPGGALVVLLGLIGLIIEDFFTWRDGGQSVIGDLLSSLGDLAKAFPVLGTVVTSIGKHIYAVFETIVNLIGTLAQLLITVWVKPLDALKTFDQQIGTLFGIEDILDKMRELVALTTKIPAALGFGTKTISASSGAGAGVTVSGPSNTQTNNVQRPSNTQTNNVQVSVNATGATNPEAVGLAVARQMEMVLERQNRAALAALTPSVAQP